MKLIAISLYDPNIATIHICTGIGILTNLEKLGIVIIANNLHSLFNILYSLHSIRYRIIGIPISKWGIFA